MNIDQKFPKLFITILIVVSSVTMLCGLSNRLISQYQVRRAVKLLDDNKPNQALDHLRIALSAEENNPVAHRLSGEALSRISATQKYAKASYLYGIKAKSHFQQALTLDPNNGEIAYRIARLEVRLEKLYRLLHPDRASTPHKPGHYFRRAIQSRPCGISYHYAYARYLQRKSIRGELHRTLENLGYIYPQSYRYLKKEPLWEHSDSRVAFKSGVERAIKMAHGLNEAHGILSTISYEEGDLSGAIDHYRKALQNMNQSQVPAAQYKLGRLFLENDQIASAVDSFCSGLARSRTFEKDLTSLFKYLLNNGPSSVLLEFYQIAVEQFRIPENAIVHLANDLLSRRRYEEAKAIIDVPRFSQPRSAPMCMLKARIALLNEDFRTAEALLTQALSINPGNYDIALTISDMLMEKEKGQLAETILSKAIGRTPFAPAKIFKKRSEVRLSMGNFQGASADLQTALRLEPQNAGYHAELAILKLREGKRLKAIEHIEQAIKIDPTTDRYKKLHSSILTSP